MLTLLSNFYDRIFRLNPERRVEKITLYFAILGFIFHLLYLKEAGDFLVILKEFSQRIGKARKGIQRHKCKSIVI
ncbi:MAG: hypothetical protein NWQ18_03530 [Saprospiraceae bacterium]|nr:hypothetical protein [Saprospiraceae bacterium]